MHQPSAVQPVKKQLQEPGYRSPLTWFAGDVNARRERHETAQPGRVDPELVWLGAVIASDSFLFLLIIVVQ